MARIKQPKRDPSLPENLLENRHDNGKTYYLYRFPEGHRRSLGTERDHAVAAAKLLNDRTRDKRARLKISRAANAGGFGDHANATVRVAADLYLKSHWVTKLSENSRQRVVGHLKSLANFTGPIRISEVETAHLAQFLRNRTLHSHNQHRQTFQRFWKFAKSEGYTRTNPAADLLPYEIPKRKRHRHTWQGLQKSLTEAPEWLKSMVMLQLYLAQRRIDVLSLTWDRVNLAKRSVLIRQTKTGMFLEITLGDEAWSALRWFHNQRHPKTGRPMDCSFVVHAPVDKRTPQWRKAVKEGKIEEYQVTLDRASRTFSKWRDKNTAYDHIEVKRQRPALNDMRALGIFMLSKAGYPDEYIQALAGHAGLEMTYKYIEGHEQVKPIQVEAGLSLSRVDWNNIDWNQPLSPVLEQLISEGDED